MAPHHPLVPIGLLHAVVAGGMVWGWAAWAHPDLSDIRNLIPAQHVIVAAVVFSLVNATLEEVIWRGVLFEALRATCGDRLALLVQGVAFGVLHAHGVPRGAVGEALASAFGLSQGWLRLRTRGLLTPILVHVLVDAVIFWVVYDPSLVRR